MTRESEKSKIRMSVIVDGKHINSLKKADEVIDQIFDEFGEQLKDKDDEIELLKCRIEEAMKPKTCYGCRYGRFGVDSFGLEIECTLAYRCSRGQDDMFKPKDNK